MVPLNGPSALASLITKRLTESPLPTQLATYSGTDLSNIKAITQPQNTQLTDSPSLTQPMTQQLPQLNNNSTQNKLIVGGIIVVILIFFLVIYVVMKRKRK